MGRKVIMFKSTNIIKKITKHSYNSNSHSNEHASELVQFTIRDRQRKKDKNKHAS
jgi:hypothetical protein